MISIFKKNSVLAFAFLFCCILFIILFIILAFNNRFSEDDFAFYAAVKKQGIIDASIQNFNSWNSRWASLLLVNSIFYFLSYHSSLLLYHLIEIAFLIFSVFLAIKYSLIYFFKSVYSFGTILISSILFCLLFFYVTFNKGETWFWVTASGIYLWSISFLCLGAGLILKNKKRFPDFIIISICGIFIGGSSEVLAVTIVFILSGSILFYRLIQRHTSDLFPVIILFCIFTVTSFFIAYGGHGTQTRRLALPHPDVVNLAWIYVKSMGKLCLLYLPAKIGASLIFGLPFIFLGSLVKKNDKPFVKISKKNLFIILIFFFLLVALSIFPVVYILGEAGPERSWTQISFYLAIFSSSSFFILGIQMQNLGIVKVLSTTSILILFFVLIYDNINQFVLTSAYASAVDSRVSELILRKQNNYRGLVELDSLPSSGYLHSAEISADTDYFSNLQLKNALELPFSIKIKNR